MKIEEKDVVSIVKYGTNGNWWVILSPVEDVHVGFGGVWYGAQDMNICYRYWLAATGVKLTVRKPVRVRLSAEIVPTSEGS